ncbi:MAG: helix-turn-helix transcriptional regulator [Verrucomicrobia bacterium]|nr:helix-turn-helix transcriptional regulator [Verrucomicrobiota bacterium]
MPRKLPRGHDPEVEQFINELRTWCKAKYGRQRKLANTLGVDERRVSEWLAGRSAPSLGIALRIQKFLRAQQPPSSETSE